MSDQFKRVPFPEEPKELMVQIRAMINDMRERGADPKIVTLNAEDYAKAEKFLKR